MIFIGCSEAYSSKDQQFACKMGCKTTTVDSALPDFTHLYSSQNSSDILELDIGPSLGTIWSSLLQSFISNSDSGGNAVDFYSLNEHAENMNRLAAPYRHSDVTIFTSDVSSTRFRPKSVKYCYVFSREYIGTTNTALLIKVSTV